MATGEDVQVKFGASVEGLVAGCHQVQEAIEGLAAPVQNFMSAIGGIGEAVIAAFAIERIGDWSKEIAEAALRTVNLAQATGQSAEEMQSFQTMPRASAPMPRRPRAVSSSWSCTSAKR